MRHLFLFLPPFLSAVLALRALPLPLPLPTTTTTARGSRSTTTAGQVRQLRQLRPAHYFDGVRNGAINQAGRKDALQHMPLKISNGREMV